MATHSEPRAATDGGAPEFDRWRASTRVFSTTDRGAVDSGAVWFRSRDVHGLDEHRW